VGLVRSVLAEDMRRVDVISTIGFLLKSLPKRKSVTKTLLEL
jgi:hypothetical protein